MDRQTAIEKAVHGLGPTLLYDPHWVAKCLDASGLLTENAEQAAQIEELKASRGELSEALDAAHGQMRRLGEKASERLQAEHRDTLEAIDAMHEAREIGLDWQRRASAAEAVVQAAASFMDVFESGLYYDEASALLGALRARELAGVRDTAPRKHGWPLNEDDVLAEAREFFGEDVSLNVAKRWVNHAAAQDLAIAERDRELVGVRDEEQDQAPVTAICVECDPLTPQEFPDEYERNLWRAVHGGATGHTIKVGGSQVEGGEQG